jgi:hypothetical protein
MDDSYTVAEVHFIAKDAKHETEKPYSLYYEPDGDIPRSNVTNELRAIKVYNARDTAHSADFHDIGFAALGLKSTLSPEDFYQQEKVVKVYYGECNTLLRMLFPNAAKIEVLEHVVSSSIGFRVHSDYCRLGNVIRLFQSPPVKTMNTVSQALSFTSTIRTTQPKCQAASVLASSQASTAVLSQSSKWLDPLGPKRIVMTYISLWKPITGPVHDWPLALCDLRTVDHATEVIGQDLVERDFFNENARVYHSNQHKWYYYRALQDDEVLVFKQSDSDSKQGAGKWIRAFYLHIISKDK